MSTQTSPISVKTPTPSKKIDEDELSFPDALREVIKGYRITKKEWDDSSTYLYLKGEFFMIHKADGSEHSIILRDGDLLGTDWEVLEDQ